MSDLMTGSWHAVAKLLAGDIDFKIAGMYIEFENVAVPTDTVTAPSFDYTEGVEYYQGLATAPTRDFLRVPLISGPVESIGPAQESVVEAGKINKLSFVAQTSGSVGIHGKTFSAAANSKVFGFAVVAMPDAADYTKDIIFARKYYATSEQLIKQASSQINVPWDITFSWT